MNKEERNLYIKVVLNLLLDFAGLLLLLFLVPKLLIFFWPFVAAYLLSAIVSPMVRFLEKKLNIRRKHGTVLLIVLLLLLVVFIIFGIFQFIFGQIGTLIENLPSVYESLQNFVTQLMDSLRRIVASLPPSMQTQAGSLQESIGNSLGGLLEKIDGNWVLSAVGNATSGIAGGALNVVIMFLCAYFFTADRDRLAVTIRQWIPAAWLEKWKMVTSYFTHGVGGYFKAQFKIMCILVAVMTVWFGIMRVPFFVLIALVIGFLDFLPVLGTGFILWPWAIISLFTGHYLQAISLIALYLVCQFLHQMLQPQMVADSVGLSPLATIFLLFFGYQIHGILGMILALPIGLVVINFYRAGMFDSVFAQIRFLVRGIVQYLHLELPEDENYWKEKRKQSAEISGKSKRKQKKGTPGEADETQPEAFNETAQGDCSERRECLNVSEHTPEETYQ